MSIIVVYHFVRLVLLIILLKFIRGAMDFTDERIKVFLTLVDLHRVKWSRHYAPLLLFTRAILPFVFKAVEDMPIFMNLFLCSDH